MSPPLPPLPQTSSQRPSHWVQPMALACFWVSVACAACMLLVAVGAWPLAATERWQTLGVDAWHFGMDGSVLWLLRHPVLASVLVTLGCAVSAVSSWGVFRLRRWGLWSFVALLLVTALANFVLAWWLDGVVAQLEPLFDDSVALLASLQARRMMLAATMYGSSVVMAVMQGGLAWRLLRPDIRARFG